MIIVDDGSTDGTADYLRTLDEPVRVLFNEHLGAQVARNTGMAYAQGQYVKFLDDDDILDAEAVSAQVAFLDRNPSVDVVYSEFLMWDTSTTPHSTIPSNRGQVDSLLDALLANWWVAPFAYLWRHAAIAQIRWDENLVGLQDADFALKVALRWPQVSYLPVVVGKYRRHSSDTTSRRHTQEHRSQIWLAIWDNVQKALEETHQLTEMRRQLLAAQYYQIAELNYAHDRTLYNECLQRALTLAPSYLPDRPYYRLLVRLFGHKMAQGVRQSLNPLRMKLQDFRSAKH